MELDERQKSRLEQGREYRSMVLTVRDGGGEEAVVDGYATTFHQPYVLYDSRYYQIVEQVAPGAFDECDMTDVIMQYDHSGRVFARTKNGTLTLSTDAIGLKITADLGGTDIGRQLYQEIKGGYTNKMSFGFVVAEDQKVYTEDHETGKEICTRTITKVKKLYDVSAVSIPANDMTSISARRFSDGVIGEIKAERLERARKKTKLRILLEVSK